MIYFFQVFLDKFLSLSLLFLVTFGFPNIFNFNCLSNNPFMIQNYVELHLLFLQDDFLAASVMAVGVAVCQKMATYPLDTVQRRMMMTTSGEVVKYQSSIHAFAEIIRNEGVKSLYKGGGTCILEKITLSVIFAAFITRLPDYFSTKKSNSAADGVSAKRNGSAGGDQSASTLTLKWTYGKD